MKKRFTMGLLALALLGVTFTSTGCSINGSDVSTSSSSSSEEHKGTQYQIYLLAKETGYEGTYEDWLASIQGDSIQLRVQDAYLEWKYASENDTAWRELISLADLQGKDGVDGSSPTIGDNGNWFIAGVDTGISASGMSAYEIYCKYHPEYIGSEEQWMEDLINGKLSSKATYTVTFYSYEDEGYKVYETQQVEDGKTATKPEKDPVHDGYTFAWWCDENLDTWVFNGYPITKDIDLYAKYYLTGYTVSWYDYDNTLLDQTTGLSLGDLPTYSGSTPTRASDDTYSYTFAGWTPEVTEVTGNASYTATYTKTNLSDPTTLKADITFWNYFGGVSKNSMDDLITQFNEIYPNITIDSINQGSLIDLKEKITRTIAAKTTPTMTVCYPSDAASYLDIDSTSLVDMGSYINDSSIGLTKDEVADYLSGSFEEGSNFYQDGTYALPFAKYTNMLFYNQTFFVDNELTVPSTWEEMETLCAAIKKIDPDCIPLGCDSEGQLFATLCAQYGYDYTSIDPANHYLFNNEGAKGIVTMLKRWYDAGYFTSMQTIGNSTYMSTPFCEQKIYMIIGSSGGASYNYSDSFETSVTSIPGVKVDGQSEICRKSYQHGPSLCFFSSASEDEQKAAWLFYKFITTPENSASWCVNTSMCPIRESSFQTDIFITHSGPMLTGKDEVVRRTIRYYKSVTSNFAYFPSFGNASTVITETGNIIVNVLKGTKTLDDAFNDAITNCNA